MEHTDEQIGRVIDFLERTGQLDNTLMFVCIGDNGCSGEGTLNGLFNEQSMTILAFPERSSKPARIDQFGQPGSYNHYPVGWALPATPRSGCASSTPTWAASGTRWSCTGPRDQGQRRATSPVSPRHRHGAHGPRGHRDRRTEFVNTVRRSPSKATRCCTRSRARRSHAASPSTTRCSATAGCFTTAGRSPRTTGASPGRTGRVELRRGPLGALRPRQRPRRGQRPHGRAATGQPRRPDGQTCLDLVTLWWAEAGKYQVLPLDDRFLARALDREGSMPTTPRPPGTKAPSASSRSRRPRPSTARGPWTPPSRSQTAAPRPDRGDGRRLLRLGLYLNDRCTRRTATTSPGRSTRTSAPRTPCARPARRPLRVREDRPRAAGRRRNRPHLRGCTQIGEEKIPRTCSLGYSMDETFDVGWDKGTPVSEDYGPIARFTGRSSASTSTPNPTSTPTTTNTTPRPRSPAPCSASRRCGSDGEAPIRPRPAATPGHRASHSGSYAASRQEGPRRGPPRPFLMCSRRCTRWQELHPRRAPQP